jgi:hypothetical protein
MKTDNNSTRESWLENAVDMLSPIFKQKGYDMPKIKVSCGFPSTGNKSKHIGQCWGRSSTTEGVNQLFISPVLDEPVQVLDTLVHELVHAIDDCVHHHGPEFKKIATNENCLISITESGIFILVILHPKNANSPIICNLLVLFIIT